ncbi:MAG: YciI family protein, partial [Phycisphaerales bacterium]
AGPPGSTSRSEIAPRKDVLTGIFVIRAKDLAEAESIARECPALLHGERVLVRPASH